MRWGTYWKYELQITQIILRKVAILHPKHGLVNEVGITISLYEKPTINNKRPKFTISA
jgi:hypothetical protein